MRLVQTSIRLAVLLAALTPFDSASAQKQTLGFVVTKWNTAMYETMFMDECPAGPNPGNYEIWESTVTPEVRRSYPPMLITQVRHINYRGPNGEDICAEPTSVQDPPLKVVEGKYGYGINLDGNSDGEATPKTCKHRNFTGLNGETGIDNQMYRLMGCVEAWRSYGHIENNANAHRLSSGLGMILMEITDVDDMTNDDSVMVSFYRGTGSFSLDSKGEVLPFASYEIDHVDGVPRYDDTVSGKIVDGVLMTDSADVHLPHFGNYQYIRQLIRDLQIHVNITPESGKTSGLAYGYYGVEQFYSYVRGLLTSFPNRHKYSCPAIYAAAHDLADGHPDPETGECTTLSSAFKFEAARAFINHPDSEKTLASSEKH
ncbi:MAG: hypothetical protein P8L66_08030 [Rhodospirillaceae bacterium]|nr:hypothetical protein [Rhodospirillaceae bacterium]